jgi:hypothetical protein
MGLDGGILLFDTVLAERKLKIRRSELSPPICCYHIRHADIKQCPRLNTSVPQLRHGWSFGRTANETRRTVLVR